MWSFILLRPPKHSLQIVCILYSKRIYDIEACLCHRIKKKFSQLWVYVIILTFVSEFSENSQLWEKSELQDINSEVWLFSCNLYIENYFFSQNYEIYIRIVWKKCLNFEMKYCNYLSFSLSHSENKLSYYVVQTN